MAGEAANLVGFLIACVFVLGILGSFTSIAPTEMALRYNRIFKSVSPQVYADPGISIVGPWATMMKYPKTIQTIEFSGNYGDKPLLDARTSDGLPLTLGVAFQYRLLPEEVFQLYRTYEQQTNTYEDVFSLIATHLITEAATNFSAYEFFNDKMRIAEEMRGLLNNYFMEHLFSTVDSLQINDDDLPVPFTNAVLQAATERQNITRMTKYRDSQIVNFQTARIVAYAQANVTVNQAVGNTHRIAQNGKADAAIIEAYVEAEKMAYSAVRDHMHLEGDDLVNYIWYDTLGGGGVGQDQSSTTDTSVLLGVQPSAYISSEGGGSGR